MNFLMWSRVARVTPLEIRNYTRNPPDLEILRITPVRELVSLPSAEKKEVHIRVK